MSEGKTRLELLQECLMGASRTEGRRRVASPRLGRFWPVSTARHTAKQTRAESVR